MKNINQRRLGKYFLVSWRTKLEIKAKDVIAKDLLLEINESIDSVSATASPRDSDYNINRNKV